MDKCCVVYISYKSKLEGDEELSLKQCINVFGKKRKIFIVIPNGIPNDYYDLYTDAVILKVDDKWLSSYKNYNSMCVNKEFYKKFTNYEYVLIYQTDCWVFEDKLDYFIELGYDYYGAPWTAKDCLSWGNIEETIVGNGGFSLRKVNKMIEIATKYNNEGNAIHINEDVWFCFKHRSELNICDIKNACNFSFEKPSIEIIQNIEKHPMGLHGKFNKKFWDLDGLKFEDFKNGFIK